MASVIPNDAITPEADKRSFKHARRRGMKRAAVRKLIKSSPWLLVLDFVEDSRKPELLTDFGRKASTAHRLLQLA